MPRARLELARLSARDFESRASTDSAIGAKRIFTAKKRDELQTTTFLPYFSRSFLVETLIFKRVAAYFYTISNPLRLPIPPPRLVEAELSTNHFFGSSESAHGKVFASALATSMAVLMPVFGG